MREGNKVLEKKDELLGSAPLGPLILKMVLPAVTAQIIYGKFGDYCVK